MAGRIISRIFEMADNLALEKGVDVIDAEMTAKISAARLRIYWMRLIL